MPNCGSCCFIILCFFLVQSLTVYDFVIFFLIFVLIFQGQSASCIMSLNILHLSRHVERLSL